MPESAPFARRGHKGGARATTLAGAINDAVLSIGAADLSTWAGATTNGPATATIDMGSTAEETIEFTGITGNTLTGVTRGVGGTTARAHSDNAPIVHSSQVRDYDEANRAVVLLLGPGPLTGAGVDTTASPSGYQAEFRFNNTALNAACGLSTLGTGAPIMHFDHRAANNTGVWSWRNGTGAASTRMSLDGSGNLSPGAGVGTGGRAVVGTNAVTIANAGADAPVPGAGDGTIYVLNGALKYRGATGTITTLAAS